MRRFFLLLFVFVVIAAGFSQAGHAVGYTTRLDVYNLSFAGEKVGDLRLRLTGENARLAGSHFRVNPQSCNVCLNPGKTNWFRFKFYNDKKLMKSVDVHLDSGQTYPYEKGCLPELTTASRQYFASLLVTKHNRK